MSVMSTTSPTSAGVLPDEVTNVGGLVIDLVGLNGVRVVAQLSASSLFVGFAPTIPFSVGTQTGFTQDVIDALGGGLAEVAVRLTLYDGDTAEGDFQHNGNELLLNGVSIGNFSDVETERHNDDGSTVLLTENGFADNAVNTGWFYSDESATLDGIYQSLSSGQIDVGVSETIFPFNNFYDFSQGLEGGLVDIGTGPIIGPEPVEVPEYDHSGDDGNNKIIGTDADEFIFGGGGHDAIDGRGGFDTAGFSGDINEYVVYVGTNNSFRVKSENADEPGWDVANNVEAVFFEGASGALDTLIIENTVFDTRNREEWHAQTTIFDASGAYVETISILDDGTQVSI